MAFNASDQKIKKFGLGQKYVQENAHDSYRNFNQDLLDFLYRQFRHQSLTMYGRGSVSSMPYYERGNILESIEIRREFHQISIADWRPTWAVFRNQIMSADYTGV